MKILPILLAVILASCAAPIRNVSKIQYNVSDVFTGATLREGGIAILPVIAGPGQEGYRRPLADSLDYHVRRTLGSTKLRTWKESAQTLNDSGLTQTYESLIASYRATSVVDRATIKRLGGILGTRYLLQTSLGRLDRETSTRWSVLSGTYTEDEKRQLEALAQVWDTQTGEVVFEALGGSKAQSNELSYVKDDRNAFSGVAARGIASLLPVSNAPGTGLVGIRVEDQGVIDEVVGSSPAAKAGLEAGDVIQAIDGVRIEQGAAADYQQRIIGQPGTKVVILVLRDGVEKEFTVTRRKP